MKEGKSKKERKRERERERERERKKERGGWVYTHSLNKSRLLYML